MTGLEKMINEIRSEAEASAAAIIETAKKEADEIIRNAKAKAAQQCGVISEQSAVDVSDHLARAKSAAALQKRKSILNAKQEIIRDVINKAQQSLYDLPDDQYFAAILKMAEKFALPQKGEILFCAKDLKRLPADFETSINKVLKENAKLTISKETRDIDGGFVLVYGGVEENCSFDALFDSVREVLQDKVHEVLF